LSKPSIARAPVVDAFRGAAILLVILYHLDIAILLPGGWGLTRDAQGVAVVSGQHALLQVLLLPFHMGRIGVNLFFVISGLCIHLRLARLRAADPDAPLSMSGFFKRRFFRIYPAYWTSLVIAAFVVPVVARLVYPRATPRIGAFPTVADFATHAVMLHSFAKPYMLSINAAMWSIGTEEQFYLLYPLVFVMIGRRVPVTRLVLALLVFTLAWRLAFVLANSPPPTFWDGPFLVWVWGFSLSRYFEWSLGALLAWALAERRTLAMFPGRLCAALGARPRLVIALGVGFIVMGMASLVRVRVKWMVEDPCYSFGWFLILAAAVLPASQRVSRGSAAGHSPSTLTRLLEGLGRRSYTVYLMHGSALFLAVGLRQRFHLGAITAAALGCGLIVAICAPFYTFIEAPSERRSKRVDGGVERRVPARAQALRPAILLAMPGDASRPPAFRPSERE
jgi:peptidoglycan/LPS O-acetylase OafA/YrhL